MAKLTNVKTVDMVNGEITKVAYDGAEYAKVDGSAKIGDLVLCLNNTPFFTVGEFYFAWDLYEGGEPRMEDDAGGNYHMRPNCRALFRKISAPTLEERVSSLESDVAALKSSSSSLKGAKANETIEFEGATYRKVDREAREGDVVILRKNTSNCAHNNKPYLVIEVIKGKPKFYEGNRVSVYSVTYGRTRETVDVYEPIEQTEYIPQEGDIVVIIKSEHGSRNSVGDIGKVSNVSPVNFAVDVPHKPEAPLVNGNKHVAHEVRKATPVEVEAYEKAAHKASFAVGDYVKVTNDFCDEVVSVGDICEIVHDDGSYLPFKLKRLTDGKISGYMYAHGLVKATDAEIAKATAPKLKAGDFVKITSGTPSIIEGEIYEVLRDDENELHIIDKDGDSRWFPLALGRAKYEIVDAETAKWAKLGRKVNEVKVGDLVEITDKCGAANVGEIVKVKRAVEQGDGGTRIYYDHHKQNDYTAHEGSYKLVAPVESTVA